MEIITLIISSVALLVSVANFHVIRELLKELRAKPDSSPTVGTKGAGGGGW